MTKITPNKTSAFKNSEEFMEAIKTLPLHLQRKWSYYINNFPNTFENGNPFSGQLTLMFDPKGKPEQIRIHLVILPKMFHYFELSAAAAEKKLYIDLCLYAEHNQMPLPESVQSYLFVYAYFLYSLETHASEDGTLKKETYEKVRQFWLHNFLTAVEQQKMDHANVRCLFGYLYNKQSEAFVRSFSDIFAEITEKLD